MARRSGRLPFLSEPDRLLAALAAVRNEVVRAEGGVKIGSESYQALERFRGAVDDLVEVVTGDRETLWNKPHSIGANG